MGSVTVFYGLYGSGKTEIAINYAIKLAGGGKGATLVDLDAVTPYFRVRDVQRLLAPKGVAVVAPKDSIRHMDLPVLPEGIRRVLQAGDSPVVVDLGGDPTGARVLGGLRDALPDSAQGFFVVNFRRPFTRTVPEAIEALGKIAASSGLSPSGLVSNTHLGELTTTEHVLEGFRLTREMAEKTGLPVVFCALPSWLKEQEESLREKLGEVPLFWLDRFLRKPWEPLE